MKDIVKKLLKVKTLIITVLMLVMSIYYVSRYHQNKILIFDNDDNIVLLGLVLGLYWIIFALIIVYLRDRKELRKKNEIIELLLKEIKEQNERQGIRSEQQYDGILRSNKQIKEIIIDKEEWSA